MRVFPDIPVTSKGNETRMGKGKGSFEYWACRVPINKIVFEIGGGGMRRETAKEALRLASDKLPVKTEFVEVEKNSRLETSIKLLDKKDSAKDNSVKSQATVYT
ncbi:11705_t:CDS:1 [Acaulospora colombiana]|uniref:11705_t:CDS:1 n=1 Tax=Acaulospora colombiana TaxID=27376 RepID=A0ACA9LWJ1_9GLOM|nr:11705_t:CDS:1 [Acaulospora colombiana]